jgi:hypothetical protein
MTLVSPFNAIAQASSDEFFALFLILPMQEDVFVFVWLYLTSGW